MKRNHQFDCATTFTNQELTKRVAHHEAGHAAAIYLCNKQKKLPPVFFQININQPDDSLDNLFETRATSNEHVVSAVEGGRLIHNLPISLIESANYFSHKEQDTYQTAFEADMINLLAGPLAEAKYVSRRDNEPFRRHSLNADSLRFYGGSSDLERVQDYLENFIPDKEKHEEKINELFHKAFAFIDTPKYWRAIERLAAYIMAKRNNAIISCEEAIAVLEQSTASPAYIKSSNVVTIEK